MKSKLIKFAQATTFGIALAFTLSCSGGDDSSENGNNGGGGGGGSGSRNIVYGTSVTYGDETYQTVVIGSQTWMARNLNYNIDGSNCYNDDPANCATYGRLYDWATAMALDASCNSSTCASQVNAKHKGICPDGWHIPSNAEWDALMVAVGGASTAGTKLKATSGWYDDTGKPGNGTDNYGFTALPGGSRFNSGYFNINGFANWWSTSEYDSESAYREGITSGYPFATYFNYSKYNSESVRCLKD